MKSSKNDELNYRPKDGSTVLVNNNAGTLSTQGPWEQCHCFCFVGRMADSEVKQVIYLDEVFICQLWKMIQKYTSWGKSEYKIVFWFK